MRLPSSVLDAYRIAADAHQLVLYEKGEPEGETEGAPRVRGFHPVGHYTSPESLLNGLVWRLRKSKTQRAASLQEWAEKTLQALKGQDEGIRKIAREVVDAWESRAK
jgi:hypothetical protein